MIPEGQCVAGYTGGGDMCLEETERPLLARGGPLKPAKYSTCLYSTHFPVI